jgi:hypothetical protein
MEVRPVCRYIYTGELASLPKKERLRFQPEAAITIPGLGHTRTRAALRPEAAVAALRTRP